MDQLGKMNIKKMTVAEIKEVLKREESLLKNRGVVNKLPDKGESIIQLRELLYRELKFREDLEIVERDFKGMKISDPNVEKHTQRLCGFEKMPGKERYKPFATLNTMKKITEGSKILTIMEDRRQTSRPAKLIPLPESLNIQKEQGARVEEGRMQIGIKGLKSPVRGEISSSECSDYASQEALDDWVNSATEK